MIGTITGRRIAQNRDGNTNVRLLQVEIIQGEDIRTVEIFCPMDYNPANGTQVDVITVSGVYQIAIGFSDGLTPEVDPGEYEIYSTDNPVTAKQATIRLNADGEIILNSGTGTAVEYGALDTALQLLVTAINAALATKLDGAGSAGGLTLDITAAEKDKVKL